MSSSSLNRLTYLLIAVALLGCNGQEANTRASSTGRPQNVLLITIDTLRSDHLSCYGYDRPTSPTIDALADDGTRFARAFSHASLTLPSHASIMTGQLPLVHGARTNWESFPGSAKTLAEICREQGLATGAVIGGFVLNKRFGLARGFDHYDDDFERASRPAEQVFDATMRWLETVDEDEPYFLWTHFMDPHAPYAPPRAIIEAVAPDLADQVEPLETVRVETLYGRDSPSADELDALMMLYDLEIRTVDRVLARVFETLEESGRLSDTLVVLTSDHGEGFDHGYFFDHGDRLYDSQIHVPLIVSHASLPKGRVIAPLVRHVDLVPTITDIMGWPTPGGLNGDSLVPLMADNTDDDDARIAFSQTYLRRAKGYGEHQARPSAERSAGTISSYRTLDSKLIRVRYEDETRADAYELYDVATDSLELDQQAQARPADVAELAVSLSAIADLAGPISGTADPGLTEDELDKLRALGYVGP